MTMRVALPVVILLALMSGPTPAQTLTAVDFRPDAGSDSKGKVEVFADGNFKSVLEDGADVGSITGAIGVRYVGSDYLLTAQISVAATSDTIRSGWGSTLLNPAVGRTLRAGLLEVQYTGWTWAGFHPRAYTSVSSSVWAAVLDGEEQEQAQATTALGLGIGLVRVLVDPSWTDRDVAVTGEIGITLRWLQGDVANDELADFKTATLGVDDERWWGPEIGFTIQVKDVVAGLTYYFFDTDVPGFSDGQVAAGVSLKAAILGP